MIASEGQIGRVFVIRLEEGDVVPDCIEQFAADNDVAVGQVILMGGIDGGEVVVGPRISDQRPPDPMLLPVDGAHETVAVGVLAPTEDGRPVLHIHGALGRNGSTMTGCLRSGVNVWVVGEVILCEILGTGAKRLKEPDTGFVLLRPDVGQRES